jgi:uncharacterized membrane protein (UPF0127 family)
MQDSVIAQRITFLIKNLALLLLIACQWNSGKQDGILPDPFKDFRQAELKTKDGQKIPIRLLFTDNEQAQGLSGVRPEDFSEKEGVLFYYTEMGPRRFWMPDTYFDLDIVFLDGDMTIVHVERNVPAHPGINEAVSPIYRTPTIHAHYVLEVKANGPYKENFIAGEKLTFLARHSLKQIESKIRQIQ